LVVKVALCFHCNNSLDVSDSVGRGEQCAKCLSSVKVCLNCEFYDASSNNECRESEAERVVDKEKANFCDFFKLGFSEKADGDDSKEKAKEELDKLFKK